jgi:RNA polymerase sigma-70 factor (ECF subfamily)
MSEAHRKAAKGPPDAGVWLDQHGDYLFKFAVFRLRDTSAAEDVVQETLLAALKAY